MSILQKIAISLLCTISHVYSLTTNDIFIQLASYPLNKKAIIHDVEKLIEEKKLDTQLVSDDGTTLLNTIIAKINLEDSNSHDIAFFKLLLAQNFDSAFLSTTNYTSILNYYYMSPLKAKLILQKAPFKFNKQTGDLENYIYNPDTATKASSDAFYKTVQNLEYGLPLFNPLQAAIKNEHKDLAYFYKEKGLSPSPVITYRIINNTLTRITVPFLHFYFDTQSSVKYLHNLKPVFNAITWFPHIITERDIHLNNIFHRLASSQHNFLYHSIPLIIETGIGLQLLLQKNKNDETPLDIAISKDNTKFLGELLDSYQNPDFFFNALAAKASTSLLDIAIQKCRPYTIYLLLDYGANPYKKNQKGQDAFTIFDELYYKNNQEFQKYIQEKQFKSYLAKDAHTSKEIKNYNIYLIKTFLEQKKENVSLQLPSLTRLYEIPHAVIAQELKKGFINPSTTKIDGQPLWFYYMKNGNLDTSILKALRKINYNFSDKNKEGKTFLECVLEQTRDMEHGGMREIPEKTIINLINEDKASITPSASHPLLQTLKNHYSTEVFDALIKNGASPNDKNNNGDTALMTLAKSFDQKDNIFFQKLLDYGADITVKDAQGNNLAMIMAQHSPSKESLEFLFMNGISLEEKNHKGETFYDILQNQMPYLHEKGNPDYYKSISSFVKNIPHKLAQLQNAIKNNDTIDLLKKALVEGDIVFAQKIASNPLHFGVIHKNDIEFLEKVSQNSNWSQKEIFENIVNTLKANALLQNKTTLVEKDLDEALKKGDYILSKQLIKAGVPLSDFAQQKLQKDPVLHATLYNPISQKEHKKANEEKNFKESINSISYELAFITNIF